MPVIQGIYARYSSDICPIFKVYMPDIQRKYAWYSKEICPISNGKCKNFKSCSSVEVTCWFVNKNKIQALTDLFWLNRRVVISAICSIFNGNMPNIRQKYARYLTETCPIFKRCPLFNGNMPDIQQKYAWYSTKICLIFNGNMSDIQWKYARYSTKIFKGKC